MSYDIEARLSLAEELLACAFDCLQDLNLEDSSIASEILDYFEKYGVEEE